MPELPEVETVVRGLKDELPGLSIRGVEILRPDLLGNSPAEFTRSLIGRQIQSVSRRAKHIVVKLDDGLLVVHLGMTGQLLFTSETSHQIESTHPGVRFTLDGGNLVYDDTRRFGSLTVYTEGSWLEKESGIGPEPFDENFTAADFATSIRKSRSPVRSWLLDQRKIAGVGNIYALEALFRVGIHPQRRGQTLRVPEAQQLHSEIITVLREAIDRKGTTLRNYRDASGEEGEYGGSLLVYGREGLPCPRCGESVKRVMFSARSAFFCPRCQPRN